MSTNAVFVFCSTGTGFWEWKTNIWQQLSVCLQADSV